MVAIISLRNQTIDVYDAAGQVTRSPISSGQVGFETPRGVFSIIQKNEEHFSNLYDDAPMPFMQRITWSGVALHAGNLPGYPASHGCIRLPYDFAQRLFSMTQMGMRVIVTNGSPAPSAITHARLMAPISVDPAATAVAAAMTGDTLDMALAGGQPPSGGISRVAFNDPLAPGESANQETLPPSMNLGAPSAEPQAAPLPSLVPATGNPLAASGRFLDVARVEANGQLTAADRRIALAKADLARIQKENAVALRSTVAAERALVDADRRVTAAGIARARARNEKEAVRAEEAELRAEIDVLTARAALETATPEAMAARGRVAAAVAVLKSAEAERAAKAKFASDLNRRAKPISIFISRQTQRLYVRQGFEPVVDMPIEIREPSRPIGTHVFTAMTSRFEPASASWHVVTVTDAASASIDAPATRSRRGEARSTPTSITPATEALDRVVIPDAISRQIAESVRAGASIVISDEGISNETGKGTDFVILSR